MSTIEDFENAPVGATATSPNGLIAFKTEGREFEWSIYDSRGVLLDTRHSQEMVRFTLNPAALTTAREALDLAWNLAHPVKEGQMFPAGTELLQKNLDGTIRAAIMPEKKSATEIDENHTRTLDPLPDPEPDWLDAHALPTREQIAMAIYKVLKPQYCDFGVPDDAADAVLDLLKEQDR